MPVVADPGLFSGGGEVPAWLSRLPKRALAALVPLAPTYILVCFRNRARLSGPDCGWHRVTSDPVRPPCGRPFTAAPAFVTGCRGGVHTVRCPSRRVSCDHVVRSPSEPCWRFHRGSGDPTIAPGPPRRVVARPSDAGRPGNAPRPERAPVRSRPRLGSGAGWLLETLPDLLGEGDDDTGSSPHHARVAEARRRRPGWRVPRSCLVLEALVPAASSSGSPGAEAFGATGGSSAASVSLRPGAGDGRGLGVAPDARGWAMIPSWEWLRAGVDGARSATAVRCARGPAGSRSARPPARRGPRAAARRPRRRGVDRRRGRPARARRPGLAVSFGDYHVAKDIGWALTGSPCDDAGLAVLLEPYAGHRYRVQRLLELARGASGRAGPPVCRFPPTSPPADPRPAGRDHSDCCSGGHDGLVRRLQRSRLHRRLAPPATIASATDSGSRGSHPGAGRTLRSWPLREVHACDRGPSTGPCLRSRPPRRRCLRAARGPWLTPGGRDREGRAHPLRPPLERRAARGRSPSATSATVRRADTQPTAYASGPVTLIEPGPASTATSASSSRSCRASATARPSRTDRPRARPRGSRPRARPASPGARRARSGPPRRGPSANQSPAPVRQECPARRRRHPRTPSRPAADDRDRDPDDLALDEVGGGGDLVGDGAGGHGQRPAVRVRHRPAGRRGPAAPLQPSAKSTCPTRHGRPAVSLTTTAEATPGGRARRRRPDQRGPPAASGSAGRRSGRASAPVFEASTPAAAMTGPAAASTTRVSRRPARAARRRPAGLGRRWRRRGPRAARGGGRAPSRAPCSTRRRRRRAGGAPGGAGQPGDERGRRRRRRGPRATRVTGSRTRRAPAATGHGAPQADGEVERGRRRSGPRTSTSLIRRGAVVRRSPRRRPAAAPASAGSTSQPSRKSS